MKYSGIGGQAVIEGVMMKKKDECAVAVRKANGEIEIKKERCRNLRDQSSIARFPVIRGIVTFVESLSTGMNMLNYSASLFEEEGENGEDTKDSKEKKEKKESLVMGLVMILAVIIAIAIFVIAPFLVSESLRKIVRSSQLRGLIEGVLRVILFVAYVKLISRMEDIKRVFMYHGAEHKSINCIENGYDLTVENVRKQSTWHKRCGTSFLLVVMFVSILFFMFIVVQNMWLRMAFRILLIPIIAGVSYEFIRYTGSHDNVISNILSKPGMWLQGLTTAEPDDQMIEVAIASVEAVFDWKTFVAEVRGMPVGEKDESLEEVASQEEKDESPEEAAESSEGKSESPKEKDTPVEAISPEKESAVTDESGIEIFAVDDNDEEDDEILNALDRYFEAPK